MHRFLSAPPISFQTNSAVSARIHILVFAVGLTVRVLYLWLQSTFQLFDIYFYASDSRAYDMLARSLREGQGFAIQGQPTAYVTPGYPLFLVGLDSVGIADAFRVGIVQCLLGALTCVLVAIIGAHLGGRRVGFTAGLISAVYPHLIFWTGYLLTETLFVFMAMASLVVLIKWRESPSQKRILIAGLLLGLAALVRPQILGFAILVPVWMVISRTTRAQALRAVPVLLLGVLIPLAPWTLRNYWMFGEPVFTSTETGIVFYQGNSPGATGGSRGYVDGLDFVSLQLPPGLTEVEINRIYLQQAIAFDLSHPERLPYLAFKKFVNMWRPVYEGASMRNILIMGGSYLLERRSSNQFTVLIASA